MAPSSPRGGKLFAAPGYRFILASVLLVILGLLLSWPWLTVPGLLGTVFFAYFFNSHFYQGVGHPVGVRFQLGEGDPAVAHHYRRFSGTALRGTPQD